MTWNGEAVHSAVAANAAVGCPTGVQTSNGSQTIVRSQCNKRNIFHLICSRAIKIFVTSKAKSMCYYYWVELFTDGFYGVFFSIILLGNRFPMFVCSLPVSFFVLWSYLWMAVYTYEAWPNILLTRNGEAVRSAVVTNAAAGSATWVQPVTGCQRIVFYKRACFVTFCLPSACNQHKSCKIAGGVKT